MNQLNKKILSLISSKEVTGCMDDNLSEAKYRSVVLEIVKTLLKIKAGSVKSIQSLIDQMVKDQNQEDGTNLSEKKIFWSDKELAEDCLYDWAVTEDLEIIVQNFLNTFPQAKVSLLIMNCIKATAEKLLEESHSM